MDQKHNLDLIRLIGGSIILFVLDWRLAALVLIPVPILAVALRHFPHIAGTASAMLGFIQMTLSGTATAVVGMFLVDTPYPMMYCMFLITSVAMLLAIVLYRQRDAGADSPVY